MSVFFLRNIKVLVMFTSECPHYLKQTPARMFATAASFPIGVSSLRFYITDSALGLFSDCVAVLGLYSDCVADTCVYTMNESSLAS